MKLAFVAGCWLFGVVVGASGLAGYWYWQHRNTEVWVAMEPLRSDHGLMIPPQTEFVHEAWMPEGFARLNLSINVEGETLALFETRQEQRSFLAIPYWITSDFE